MRFKDLVYYKKDAHLRFVDLENLQDCDLLAFESAICDICLLDPQEKALNNKRRLVARGFGVIGNPKLYALCMSGQLNEYNIGADGRKLQKSDSNWSFVNTSGKHTVTAMAVATYFIAVAEQSTEYTTKGTYKGNSRRVKIYRKRNETLISSHDQDPIGISMCNV